MSWPLKDMLVSGLNKIWNLLNNFFKQKRNRKFGYTTVHGTSAIYVIVKFHTSVKYKKNLVIYCLFFFGKNNSPKFGKNNNSKIFFTHFNLDFHFRGIWKKNIITFWIGSKIMLSFLGVVAIDATSENSKGQRKHFTFITSFASKFKTNFSLEFDWKKKPSFESKNVMWTPKMSISFL